MGESIMAPRVFLWRQPFRSLAIPDQLHRSSQRGVVFIHGFVCNRGFWNPWMERLKNTGHPFVAVNLEPVFGSIAQYAPIIEAAIERVTQATGQPPLVVCHSMGGLAIRAWLRANRSNGLTDDRIYRVVTIGSPHHGTWLARFSFSVNGVQMRRPALKQVAWLGLLALDEEKGRYGRFLCFYSNCDNIVFPASTAMLESADNRLIAGAAHVDMAFDEQVIRQSLMLLTPPN
jgi:triacylglycerol esterase/lipase EstA (alpha/beta hydrolase family)